MKQLRSISWNNPDGANCGYPDNSHLSHFSTLTEPANDLDHVVFSPDTLTPVDEQRSHDGAVYAAHECTFSVENFGAGGDSGDWVVGLLRNGELIGSPARFPAQSVSHHAYVDLRDVHSGRPVIFKRSDVLTLALLEVPSGKLTGIAGIKAHVRGVSFGRRSF